jgi:hypothetical protein
MTRSDWLIVAQAARTVRATGEFAAAPLVGGRWEALACELLELKACFEQAGVERHAIASHLPGLYGSTGRGVGDSVVGGVRLRPASIDHRGLIRAGEVGPLSICA